jgi:hypothetical protein
LLEPKVHLLDSGRKNDWQATDNLPAVGTWAFSARLVDFRCDVGRCASNHVKTPASSEATCLASALSTTAGVVRSNLEFNAYFSNLRARNLKIRARLLSIASTQIIAPANATNQVGVL